MRIYYDFHIHSCLSPCGDEDMTPCNIVGMAILNGLEAIAVTDHNSAGNVRAVTEASRRMGGPLVVPGMELETAENVHLVCLFPSVEVAETFSGQVHAALPQIPLRADIYGEQSKLDEFDNRTGSEEFLLVNATSLSLFDALKMVKSAGGICYPAHIDREANGILAIFGAIPPEAEFRTVEFSANADKDLQNSYMQCYNILYGSDAHYLESISERDHSLDVQTLSVRQILCAADRPKPSAVEGIFLVNGSGDGEA